MRIKIQLFLFLSIFSFLQSHAQYFKHLGMKEGLSQLSVLAIYQDSLGRMWFGTHEGVNVYDGKHISVHKPWSVETPQKAKHLLTGNEVNMLAGNSAGDIFMRVEGALVKYDIRKETFTQLKTDGVRAITTYQGDIWCIIYNSLFTYQSDSLVFKRKLDVPYVSCLLISNDNIWVGTSKGLYLFNQETVQKFLPEVEIYRLFESSHKELWIASRTNGLYRIKKDGELVKEPYDPHSNHTVASNQIRNFAEDNQENIWFGTFEGVQMYDSYTDTYSVYRAEGRAGTLSHSSVFSVFKDKQGTIWLGTYYGGVNYFNPLKDIFSYYPYDIHRTDCLNFPLVGPMVEDKDRLLWISTDGGGVNCLNRATGKFTYHTATTKNSILHNNVKSICYDEKRDCIYIGTYTGGLSKYDKKTGKFYNYSEHHKPNEIGPDTIIFQVAFERDRLYVSSRNGLWEMNPDTGKFKVVNNEDYFLTFEIDPKGYAWATTGHKLYRIDLKSPSTKKPVKLTNSEGKYKISKILKSSDGMIYVGTLGNGFYTYDEKADTMHHYSAQKDNLLSNYCYNLIESPRNNILITSERGITLFSPYNLSARSVEIGTAGGITAIANGCGAYVTSDEQIYVGGVDGMVAFREEDLEIEDDGGYLYFSNLQVHNTRIYPDDESGILKQSMPFTKRLDLSSSQNNLIVSFSKSNYLNILKNTWYEYKLEGFDEEWIPTTQTNLYYTNVPPGKYTLRLRSTNKSMQLVSDTPKEISLEIVVHYPWYNTIWAWLFYIFFTGTVVYWIWHVKMVRKTLALSLEQEKKEKEHIEKLNHAKLIFFTNVSHEFRTPLTLIIGQIENLVQIHKLSPSIHNRLLRVYKNAMHMRLLISELLDFRKQEQGYMKLKVIPQNIVSFTQEIYLSFYEYAQKRNITYSFEHGDDHIELWFDPIQLQKVIFNLISNAFKYTPEKGYIQIAISNTRNQVKIDVKDSGCGISEEVIPRIFERFYQAEDASSGLTLGTGIGLALAKGIAEAHKGEISVTSEVGKGSIFTITLPTGNAHFSEEELSQTANDVLQVSDNELPLSEACQHQIEDEDEEQTTSNASQEKPTILLVEDSRDIMEMLIDIFSPIYHIHKASNGKEGFEMTRQLQPEIVLSDVMMPVMSGKEMCFKIKNSFDVSHIPVVLLTAQTSVEYMIEGYMFGADDYITKPFNVKLLVSRCNNLVKGRKLLSERFKSNGKIDTKPVNAINADDQNLIDVASNIIRKHFDNIDFDMNTLATELGMGRSKLFTRFKEVTGLTPNEFTLKLKLEEAIRLLKDQPQYNVSEICYKLGFSSPRYFSRCFKSFYGVTPQAYRNSQE